MAKLTPDAELLVEKLMSTGMLDEEKLSRLLSIQDADGITLIPSFPTFDIIMALSPFR